MSGLPLDVVNIAMLLKVRFQISRFFLRVGRQRAQEEEERILLTDSTSKQIRERRQHGITGENWMSSNSNSGGDF